MSEVVRDWTLSGNDCIDPSCGWDLGFRNCMDLLDGLGDRSFLGLDRSKGSETGLR